MKLRLDLRYTTAILLSAFVWLLLLAIGMELGWGSRVSLPIPQPKPQKSDMVLTPLQPEFILPPVDTGFAEILERPLLVPTRRPAPPPPPPPQVKPSMRKGQFVLLGVILTKAKNVALLREVATGKVSRVEQGAEINGIKVEKMEPERITLTQWDDREEVILKILPLGHQPMVPAQAGTTAFGPTPGAPAAPQPSQPPLPGFIPGFGPSPYTNHAQPPGSPGSPEDIAARRRAASGKR